MIKWNQARCCGLEIQLLESSGSPTFTTETTRTQTHKDMNLAEDALMASIFPVMAISPSATFGFGSSILAGGG